MALLTLKILDQAGNVKMMDSARDLVGLVVEFAYEEGDRIVLDAEPSEQHVWLQVDEVLGASLVYVTGTMEYAVPFGEKKNNLSPKAFSGDRHYICARTARKDEVYAYRNLAVNVCDTARDNNCYPHATANVETRGETLFAARNVIDGIWETRGHGNWPYESWGIDMRDDAEIQVNFGELVEVDRVQLFTRADFPHDNWWVKVTLTFSDGSTLDWDLEKSERHPHVIDFEKRQITWVKLSNLIKADDPSPFPALSQMEVYGRVCRK